MAKKTLKQAVDRFKTKTRRKSASKSPQPSLWTSPDVFFGDHAPGHPDSVGRTGGNISVMRRMVIEKFDAQLK